MKYSLPVVLIVCGVLVACGKKAETPEGAADTTAAAPAQNAAAPDTSAASAPAEPAAVPADDSPEARERAQKQAKLDYAMMEDQFLNDPKGQWATSGKASASYNEEAEDGRARFGAPSAVTGAPDNTAWASKQTQIGIDWVEAQFAKPVAATELRMVITDGVGSVSKIEVVDTDGKLHTVWSGVDETKSDDRGERTWYVTKLEPAPYKVAGARYSFAHVLNQSNKYVDAVQLVGE
jgi:hypothetical protein